MSSKTTVPDQDIRIDFDEMNHSELVKLAHWVGMKNISRAMPREMIINMLQSLSPAEIPNPIDKMRSAMKSWMRRYWGRLAMQVNKSECPNCELCDDFQAVECYSENQHQFT